MNLLHRIFFITLIIFCNYSCAMEHDNGPTLQQLFDISFDDWRIYEENIINNGSRDEKIFLASVFGAHLNDDSLKNERTFKLVVVPVYLQGFGKIQDPTDDDIKKFKIILNELFTDDLKPKQPNFKCNKKSLKKLLYPTLSDLNTSSSSLSETDEDSKESIDSIDDKPINSKFASIIQTLRTNKLILGGATFCIVAVLSGCAYALYKNSIETKKEENKKEDEEEKDDLQQKEENFN